MALSLATRYPELVDIVIPIATGARVTALQKIHNFEQIMAIENDPNFNGGDYLFYQGLDVTAFRAHPSAWPGFLRRFLNERGIEAPFPIQALTIPDALAGRDVTGNTLRAVEAPGEGTFDFFLWLRDGAGNADHNNRNVALDALHYDASPPTTTRTTSGGR